MTKAIVTKSEEVDKSFLGDLTDAMRNLLAYTLNNLMQQEAAAQIGADVHERNNERRNYRNGARLRQLHSRMGTLDLEVPRLRTASYQPSFLERYQRTERALIAVIQEAFVAGVSTRKMQNLVEQLGVSSLSKSQLSDLCADLDIEVDAFRTRPLTENYPYLMSDAVYEKSVSISVCKVRLSSPRMVSPIKESANFSILTLSIPKVSRVGLDSSADCSSAVYAA